MDNPFRVGLETERTPPPCVFVIFGASGDLTRRKLLPALYNLAVSRLLPAGLSIVGFALTEMGEDDFRRDMHDAVAQRACLPKIDRVTVEFSPRPGEKDAASTQAALLVGWIAAVLGLPCDAAAWQRGEGWSEARIGGTVARFEHEPRSDVRPGVVTRVALDACGARFEIARQEDPRVYRWSRELPSAVMPAQALRVGGFEESPMLVRCVERPRRDGVLEASLHAASRIVRSVAPRLSKPPVG